LENLGELAAFEENLGEPLDLGELADVPENLGELAAGDELFHAWRRGEP
jgi:hypothetical protein